MTLTRADGLQLHRDDLALLMKSGGYDDVVLVLQVLFPESSPEDFQDSARSTLQWFLDADRYDLAARLGVESPSVAATLASWQPTATQIALLAQPDWLWIWEQDLARLEPSEKPIGFFEVRFVPQVPADRFQRLVERASQLALDPPAPPRKSTSWGWSDWQDSSSDW